jgi:two-component system cell cycle sensor histidine kinase/response regulator CckA
LGTNSLIILAVDDNPDNLVVLEAMLADALPSCRMSTATDGPAGIALARANDPDAILLDIRMPGMDGFEVCTLLKAEEGLRDIPVLFLTAARTDRESRVRALEVGAEGFLSKPIDDIELIAQVRAMARIKASRRAGQRQRQQLEEQVTERTEQLQQELRVRERLTAAIEQAGEMVVVTDTQGTILYVNPAFETITGYSRDEALGQNPRLLKSGRQDASVYSQLWAAVTSGHTWRGRLVNRKKNGTLYTEESTIAPVRDADGVVSSFVAVKRDVSREVEVAAQLLQAQKMEGLGRIAGGVAHDFNNLLSLILNYTAFAMDEVAGQTQVQDYLTEVRSAANRAANLTSRLQSLGRRRTGQPRLLHLHAELAQLDGKILQLLGPAIEFVKTPASDLGWAEADPSQLAQLILGLVANARDAMPDGGRLDLESSYMEVPADTGVAHGDLQPGPYAVLVFRDTGAGMDEATMARIFDPFYVVPGTHRSDGMALASAYGIAKQSGGTILVESVLGEGTTFRVCLPLRQRPTDAETSPQKVQASLQVVEHTVLVVEDEPALCRVVCRTLATAGYVVLAAESGEAALEVAARHGSRIALLLTDVVMSGMNGKTLAGKLQEARPDIAVLYMSGYTDDAFGEDGEVDANIHFVHKPFTAAELLAKVRGLLV